MCIFKKIIPIFIFLSISLTSHAAQQLPEAAPEWGFVSKIQALYQQEAALKSTATYRSLVGAEIIATSLLKYATLGPWGVLGDAAYRLGQHNTSSFIIPAAERFLPQSLHSKFRQFVTAGMIGLHGYDCYHNPAQQALGYAFGLTGVFLTKHVLDQSSLGQRSRKECEAFVYYCCRKAGWETAEMVYGNAVFHNSTLAPASSSIPDSLDPSYNHDLPNGLAYSACSRVSEEADNILIYSNPYVQHNISETEQFLERTLTVDNRFYASIEFAPQCSSPDLNEDVLKSFNKTAELIVQSRKDAYARGKKLGVIWFEKHSSCSCLEQEKQLFKWLSVLGIKDFYMEGTKDALIETEAAIKRIQKESCSKQTYLSPALTWVLPRYTSATMAGLNVKHGEEPVPEIDSDWGSNKYIEKLEKFYTENYEAKRQRYHELLNEASTNKNSAPLIQAMELLQLLPYGRCPDFDARDQTMIKILKTAPNSFGALFGAAHFGAIHEGLQGRANKYLPPNFEYIYISCVPRFPAWTIFEDHFSKIKGPITQAVQNAEWCLKKLEDMEEKYTLAFRLFPPDLHRSLTPSDVEFTNFECTDRR